MHSGTLHKPLNEKKINDRKIGILWLLDIFSYTFCRVLGV